MINLTPQFLNDLINTNKGLPENLNTILNVPKIKKDWTLEYKDTPYFPNSVFPVELYMYRKETPINLKLG